MTNMMDALRGDEPSADPRFPHAPEGWSAQTAARIARDEGIEIGDDHLEVVRALQEYWARHSGAPVHLRGLHDALDEKFHRHGGMKFLYRLFPGGPVAQGCRFAGLKAPAGAIDRGFGSVA
jgi:TusE/DsrC/DsvC family sulfur relay protein